MKIKNITILFAGLAIPAVASAQLYQVPLGAGPLALMQDMSQASKSLYASDDLPGSKYTQISWAPGLFNGGAGKFKTNAAAPQFPGTYPATPINEVTFKEIKPNFSAFIVRGSVDIGFFGREAWDTSKLVLNAESMDGGTLQQTDPLFTYTKNSAPAQAATMNPVSGSTPFKLSFYHLDISENIGADLVEPLKFKIFQSFNVVNNVEILGNQFILAVDDQMNSLIDYDDGFFFVTGAITPVPEPSLIAGMAVLGMGGFLMIRRRLTAKRKQA